MWFLFGGKFGEWMITDVPFLTYMFWAYMHPKACLSFRRDGAYWYFMFFDGASQGLFGHWFPYSRRDL